MKELVPQQVPAQVSLDHVAHMVATLAQIKIGETLTYRELAVRVGKPKIEYEFDLIQAIKILMEGAPGREAMFFSRRGGKIGVERLDPNDYSVQGLAKIRKSIIRKAQRGLREVHCLAQAPDLTQGSKNLLAANAAIFGVTVSTASGKAFGNTKALKSNEKPVDIRGLANLYGWEQK